jgi:hypothetical protein
MFSSFSSEKETKASKVPYNLEKLVLVSPIICLTNPIRKIMSLNRMEATTADIYQGMPNIV